MDWTAVWLSLKLAVATTVILLAIGLPLAYALVMWRWRFKFVVESIVALPLVLPPTVLGFYVLMAIGPSGVVGAIYEKLTGGILPFSFAGLLIGSVLYNAPFAIRPFMAGFSSLDQKLLEASWCLGESQFMTFWRVSIPLSRAGILTGLVLTFAHCVGEFGVVLMIGGNIPGVTRTLSISVYDDVQALNYESAGHSALLLLVFSFVVLAVTSATQRRATIP